MASGAASAYMPLEQTEPAAEVEVTVKARSGTRVWRMLEMFFQ